MKLNSTFIFIGVQEPLTNEKEGQLMISSDRIKLPGFFLKSQAVKKIEPTFSPIV